VKKICEICTAVRQPAVPQYVSFSSIAADNQSSMVQARKLKTAANQRVAAVFKPVITKLNSVIVHHFHAQYIRPLIIRGQHVHRILFFACAKTRIISLFRGLLREIKRSADNPAKDGILTLLPSKDLAVSLPELPQGLFPLLQREDPSLSGRIVTVRTSVLSNDGDYPLPFSPPCDGN